MPKIPVLLVDDHSLVRLGFRRLLEDEPDVQVVGEAGDGWEAVRLAQQLQPAVIVMDISLPELDGIHATREILQRQPTVAVLMLSMHADANYLRHAREAGAKGYLLKNAIELELTTAIRTLAEGGTFFSPALDQFSASPDDEFDRLTPREKQVLQLIAQGNSNKEIAALLGLSANTVAVHRANLMSALNLHRTAELVLFAVRKGLVAPP